MRYETGSEASCVVPQSEVLNGRLRLVKQLTPKLNGGGMQPYILTVANSGKGTQPSNV